MKKNLLMAFVILLNLAIGLNAQNAFFDSSLPKSAAAVVTVEEPACNSDFVQTEWECAALNLWSPEKLSSPETLEQTENFKLIFHSITAFGVDGADYKQSWAYKLLVDPSLIKNNPCISASLISEKKHHTFVGTIGFVLEVPKENLVGTSTSDLGTNGCSYSQLVNRSASPRWDILAPERLLEETPQGQYNEIVAIGTHPNSKASVKVTGIIIDCPTNKMVKLNGYSTDEFYQYLSKCDLNRRGLAYAIPLLNALRTQYPVYGYSTYFLDD